MIAFRSRIVVLASSAIALLASGCFHPSYDRPTCGPQGECPDGLMCSEPLHVCLGNGGTGGDDAGADVPVSDTPPGTVCYGPSGWQVCLDAAPNGQVLLSGTLDTAKSDASNPCLKNQPASWTDALQPDACFIVGDTVTVMSVAVTGQRPLVIVARSQITVASLLDVASHRATGAVGAGAQPADCKPFGSNPVSGPGGGGAGGSFLFPGADGGTGDGGNHQGGQASGADIGAPTRLRGGCPGQPGGGGTTSDGGAGGGAMYLVSAGTITISGTINVSGAGGAGVDAQAGGGGGGSGGMIVLYGSSIMTTSATLLIANGGGGGGGSAKAGGASKGSDGHEPSLAVPILAAIGGTGGIFGGAGNGGDGGSGYATSSNAGAGTVGDIGAGGGGGGGGGGYIQSNQELGMAAVSPVATLKP